MTLLAALSLSTHRGGARAAAYAPRDACPKGTATPGAASGRRSDCGGCCRGGQRRGQGAQARVWYRERQAESSQGVQRQTLTPVRASHPTGLSTRVGRCCAAAGARLLKPTAATSAPLCRRLPVPLLVASPAVLSLPWTSSRSACKSSWSPHTWRAAAAPQGWRLASTLAHDKRLRPSSGRKASAACGEARCPPSSCGCRTQASSLQRWGS